MINRFYLLFSSINTLVCNIRRTFLLPLLRGSTELKALELSAEQTRAATHEEEMRQVWARELAQEGGAGLLPTRVWRSQSMIKMFAAAGLALALAGTAAAEERSTSAKFLSWSKDGQAAYIHTALTAAGVIANMNRDGQALCIDAWVGKNHALGYPKIINAMKTLPEYHPMGVLMAVVQKECGPFRYATASAVPR